MITETESVEIVTPMITESTIPVAEGNTREASIERLIEPAREPGSGGHVARMHAAAEGPSTTDMPAASMAGKATGMHPAAGVTTSAMPAPALRPHGHGKQKR
jgi:hypothetical protein